MIKMILRGGWVARSVKRLTLDFGSGHDLFVCSSSLLGSALTAQSLLGILSPLSLCPSPVLSPSLFLKINK